MSNGSEIRLLQKLGCPIHIQACIRCGSRYNDIPGQAHLFEHMIVAGTTNHPSKSSLSEALEIVGGYLDASTDPDFVRLTVSIPDKEHVTHAISLLKEMLTDSLFSEDVFRNEQKTVLNEMQEQKRNRVRRVTNSLLNHLYPDYQKYFDGLGTVDSVSSMKLRDIQAFAEKNLTTDRVTFVVVGDVGMDEIENELESIKLKLSETEHEATQLNTMNVETENQHDIQPESLVDIAAGFRCDIDTAEELAGLILIQQMFMGRNSPFIEALRYKQALVYSGKTLLWDYTGTSIFSVHTTCMAKNVDMVFSIMHDVFTSVSDEGIMDTKLDTIKIKAESHYLFHLQTSRQWLDAEVRALRQKTDDQESITSLSILSYIQEMNAERLTSIYLKFFRVENMSKVVVSS